MSLGPLYVLPGEVSVQVISPCFNWVIINPIIWGLDYFRLSKLDNLIIRLDLDYFRLWGTKEPLPLRAVYKAKDLCEP